MGISHFPNHQGLSYPSIRSPQGFQAPYLPTPSAPLPATESSIPQHPVSHERFQSNQDPWALQIAPGQHLNPTFAQLYLSSLNSDSQVFIPPPSEPNLISSIHQIQEQPAPSVFGDPNPAMPPTMYVNEYTSAFQGGENGAGGSYANNWYWNDPPSPFMK